MSLWIREGTTRNVKAGQYLLCMLECRLFYDEKDNTSAARLSYVDIQTIRVCVYNECIVICRDDLCTRVRKSTNRVFYLFREIT